MTACCDDRFSTLEAVRQCTFAIDIHVVVDIPHGSALIFFEIPEFFCNIVCDVFMPKNSSNRLAISWLLPIVSWCHFRSTPFTQCSEAKEPEQADRETRWYFMVCQRKHPLHISLGSMLLSRRILLSSVGQIQLHRSHRHPTS